MTKSISPYLAGFLQAVGVHLFILLGFFIGISVLPQRDPPFTPVLVLLIFSFSVLVCGCLTLGYPILLVLEKKTPDAVKVILSMVASMAIFVMVWIVITMLTAPFAPID